MAVRRGGQRLQHIVHGFVVVGEQADPLATVRRDRQGQTVGQIGRILAVHEHFTAQAAVEEILFHGLAAHGSGRDAVAGARDQHHVVEAAIDQIVEHLEHRAVVVGGHAVADDRLHDAVQHHHGLVVAASAVFGQPIVVVAHGVDDQAVDLGVEQRFDVRAFERCLVVGVADQQLDVARAALLLDAFEQQRAERVADVGDGHAHQMADGGLQPLRHLVRPVTELADHRFDASLGFGGHAPEFAVQIPRNRGFRNTDSLSHIPHAGLAIRRRLVRHGLRSHSSDIPNHSNTAQRREGNGHRQIA